MINSYEFQTVQTLMSEEVRINEETGEEYVEQIIIEEDKKLRKTISLNDISSFEELTNDKGVIYAKRCLLKVSGEPVVVTKSYKDIKSIIGSVEAPNNTIGFGRDSEEA